MTTARQTPFEGAELRLDPAYATNAAYVHQRVYNHLAVKKSRDVLRIDGLVDLVPDADGCGFGARVLATGAYVSFGRTDDFHAWNRAADFLVGVLADSRPRRRSS